MSPDRSDHRADDVVLARGSTIRLTGNRTMNRRTELFDVFGFMVVGGLLATMFTQRPEILALTAPFIVAIALALALFDPPEAEVQLWIERGRLTEGDQTTIEVELTSSTGLHHIEVELDVGDRLQPLRGERAMTRVLPGQPVRLSFAYDAVEWGMAPIRMIKIRVMDRFGLFGGRMEFPVTDLIRVGLPEDRRAAASLDAERFRRIVGSHSSSDRGDGHEIADIRPWQPGDSAKQVNWRISNRRQEPWVTLRHPDRSTTVVVVVDAHEGEGESQRSTQRQSVSAAMALTRSHLDQHDRVGLLVVGHTVAWLEPRLGRTQLWAIGDALVAVSNAPDASRRMYRPPAVATIPSNAIVVAVSPLDDQLMVRLVAELLSRGNPVSVLVPEVATETRRALLSSNRIDRQSRRLADVEKRVGIQSLRDRGAVIVPWGDDESVETILGAVKRMRQAMVRAR